VPAVAFWDRRQGQQNEAAIAAVLRNAARVTNINIKPWP